MKTKLTHEAALSLLRKYNQEPFHILHGLTVEGCMRWFAEDQGFGEDAPFKECDGYGAEESEEKIQG